MNNTAFYQGILFELNKQANVEPQKKKPWYSTPLGMGAMAGGLGLAGYGLNAMANKGMPKAPYDPKPTDFSEAPSDSVMGKTTQLANQGAEKLMVPWAAANSMKALPGVSKVAPWLNRGMLGVNGLSMMSDALDPNNQAGAGYKALQFGGGALDSGSQLLGSVPTLGKNMLQKGLTSAASNPILGKSLLRGAATAAPEVVGGRAASMLLGGPALAATAVGTAGQVALNHGTQSAQDFVNESGGNAAWLENNREGIKSMNPETRNSSLDNLYSWYRSNTGAQAQQAMTSPSGWAALGGNTHFWKNNAGAGDLATPVYKHLNDRAYQEYMAKIKELGIKEPVYQEPKPAPTQEIPGIYDTMGWN
jgi:hypothetical protein